jgi:TonB family protein
MDDRIKLALAAIAAALVPTAASAQSGLPPIPADLRDASAVTCIRIDDSGAVSSAFIVTSAGSADKDREVLAWVKQLRWEAVKPGDASRNRWMPMPVSFGSAPPPAMPSTCAPPPAS